jgi:hypothetical protein
MTDAINDYQSLDGSGTAFRTPQGSRRLCRRARRRPRALDPGEVLGVTASRMFASTSQSWGPKSSKGASS